MNKTRFLSMALAVIMLIPMFVVGTSAKAKDVVYPNIIDITEEYYVENGDFEGELSVVDKNLSYGWNAMEDGNWYWCTNPEKDKDGKVIREFTASLTKVTEGDNSYMLVESDTSTCIAYAAIADMPKGEYVLSLQIYPEAGVSEFYFDVRKLVGRSHEGLLPAYVNKSVTANTWNTISIPVEITDESADVIFRFWGGADGRAVKYRVDNVSFGRPGDVLIESADMDAVSATAVAGKWYSADNTSLALDNSGDGLEVKRNANDTKLPDLANLGYAFEDKLSKGTYKLTLDVDSPGSQSYAFQLANVSSGWATIVNPTLNKGTNVITFEIANDNTPIAFRMWPNGNYPDTYSITGMKLEKYHDPVVFENTFDSAATFTTDTTAWAAKTARNLLSCNSSTTTKDQIDKFEFATVDGDGAFHYKAKNQSQTGYTDNNISTPTFAFGLGTLEEGAYSLSFDIKKISGTSFNGRVHYYTGNTANVPVVTWQPTFTPAANAWETVTVTFVADATSGGQPFLFRFWPNADGCEFYIDNVKLTRNEEYSYVFTNKTFDNANDFVLAGNNLNGGAGDWQNKTWADSFFGGNGTLSTAEVTTFENNKVLHFVAPKGLAFGYNFGWLPKGKYTVQFKTYSIIDAAAFDGYTVYDVSAGALNAITSTKDIGLTKGAWRDNTVSFDVTSEAGAKVLFRYYFRDVTDFYVDDFKVVGITPWSIIHENDFSDADDFSLKSGEGWASTVGQFSMANGKFNVTRNNAGYVEAVFLERTPCLWYSLGHNPVGSYIVSFDIKKLNDAYGNFIYELRRNNSTAGDGQKQQQTFSNNYWSRRTYNFSITQTGGQDVGFRVWPHSYDISFAIDNIKLWGTPILGYWETLLEDDFTTAPEIYSNDKAVNITDPASVAKAAGSWFFRDIKPATMSYNSTTKALDVLPRSIIIHGNGAKGNASGDHPAINYVFNTTFTKGAYSISFNLVPEYTDTYSVSAVDASSGKVLSSTTYSYVAPGTGVNGALTFTVNGDTDVKFVINATNTDRCYAAYTVKSVDVYKLSNPVIGINANGVIASFDSADGMYYMLTDISGSGAYVNYNKGEILKAGTYKLSGYFKTTDPAGAEVSASVAYVPVEEVYEIGSDWTKVEYTVTLSRKMTLSNSNGVRFNFDSNATLYFKDLDLRFQEDLPEPALDSGIAMVLLKKLQGGMKPKVEKKLYNFMDNADFDEAPVIRETPLNYGWAGQKNGEWAISLNSADKEGTGSIAYGEVKKEEALLVTASKTNPCVSYRLKDKLDAGLYTLSIDVFAEGAGQKGFMVDVFDMKTGAAVRIGEGAAIMSRSVKAGEWSTMSVTFTATADTELLFRFWSGSALNYAVDNIKITKAGVFSDGTTEEVANDVEGLIKNGDFAEAPTIAAKTLGYGWVGAKDGEWAYSLNLGEQKDAKCTLSYGDVKGEKCLKVDTNSNPSVSYAFNGKVKPGLYTLSMDIYAEANGTKTFNVDVFDTSSGSIVRLTAGASIVNAKVKGGEWTTVSVPFTVTADADIIFRTFPAEKLGFYIDNVTLK